MDALDLYRIITAYPDAGNTERLYDLTSSVLEQANFDLELAGAMLTGRDARLLSSPATLTRLSALLTPIFVNILAERVRVSRWPFEPDQLPRIQSLLSAFVARLLE